MIILQANKFFYEKGGSERYMLALSRALEARGHRVAHFAMAHPRNLPSPYSRHFVPQLDYEAATPSPAMLRAWSGFVRSPDAARRISALLDEVQPDVAHLHNIYHQLTPSIIEVLSRRGIPIVMTLHDYKLVCPSYGMFARGAYCYRCRGARYYHAVSVGCGGSRLRSGLLAVESYWQRWTRVYDRVDRFIAPSEYLRSVMMEAGMAPERIVHISQLSAPVSGSEENDTPGAGLPSRFLVYVGRLSAEKGVAVLLAAMARAPEVELIVLGEGPEGDALRGMVGANGSTNVHFAGHAPSAVVDRTLRRAVALVLPSLSPENAPMALLEAAHAGTPVIVSDRGGLPELAARMGGCVVPAGNVDALVDAMRDAWENEDVRRARARDAWRDVSAAHSPGVHAGAIEAIYEDVRVQRTVTG